MISAFISLISWSWVTAFTLPTVPTGMKIGVLISPCAVVILPARADDALSCAISSKSIVSGAKLNANMYIRSLKSKRDSIWAALITLRIAAGN